MQVFFDSCSPKLLLSLMNDFFRCDCLCFVFEENHPIEPQIYANDILFISVFDQKTIEVQLLLPSSCNCNGKKSIKFTNFSQFRLFLIETRIDLLNQRLSLTKII